LKRDELIAELMKYGQEVPSQDAFAQLAKASGLKSAEIENLYASVIQGVRLANGTSLKSTEVGPSFDTAVANSSK